MAQRDVGRLGVERTGVRGRHRDDAEVPHVPEGGVQVVHRRAERVQVSAGGSERQEVCLPGNRSTCYLEVILFLYYSNKTAVSIKTTILD